MTKFWLTNQFLITGGNGFLGKHLIEVMINEFKVPSTNIYTPSSVELDLREKDNCVKAVNGIDIVIHLAASVGGIEYNRTHPGSLFYNNVSMGLHLLEAARIEKVKKCISIGSVCSYPKIVPIPTKEEVLWMGYPEESNAAYGVSKKMLLVQSQAYREQYGLNSIYLILANLYGPGDNFSPEKSHVIPALIHKMIQAKHDKIQQVKLWGTGVATRDFLYVKDAAKGILQAVEKYNKKDPINLASGKEISIKNLADIIKDKVDYTGHIKWDTSKPDGQPRRLFDISQAKKEFDFVPKVTFIDGIHETIQWYKKTYLRN